MRPQLVPTYSDSEVGNELVRGTDWRQGRIEDIVLTEMFIRMTPELHSKVMKIGSIYLLFEIVHAMQSLAAPVWKVMADAQVEAFSLTAALTFPAH